MFDVFSNTYHKDWLLPVSFTKKEESEVIVLIELVIVAKNGPFTPRTFINEISSLTGTVPGCIKFLFNGNSSNSRFLLRENG